MCFALTCFAFSCGLNRIQYLSVQTGHIMHMLQTHNVDYKPVWKGHKHIRIGQIGQCEIDSKGTRMA